jgi:hypothetical protein
VSGRLVVAVLALSAIAGCGSTQHSSIGFTPPTGNYRILLMRPEVSVGVLTAGGLIERREDWTNAARSHLIAALEAQQATRGADVTVLSADMETDANSAGLVELQSLHRAVGHSIRLHKYVSYGKLPSKEGKFDWTLGQAAVVFGAERGFDYALFFHAEDSFSSAGRVALGALAYAGCAFGFCLIPTGGVQAAFVSLVDLRTGQVVWFNTLLEGGGDIRTAEGAQKMVAALLDDMKPGPVPPARS